MTYKLLRMLSYLGIAAGVVLAFWEIRGGALCFMFSIACAHIAGNQKVELQSDQTQESLYIVLSLLTRLNDTLENLQGRLNSIKQPESPPQAELPTSTIRKAAVK